MKKDYEKYCHNCGAIIDKKAETCPKCGERQSRFSNNNPQKINAEMNSQWLITLLLCVILGYLGAHRFYHGKYGTAILMIITCGGFGIWYILDIIFIILGQFKDKDGNYVTMN
jgi:TM2 domain-containing membrane protein YozV/ribosomal protein L40E